MYDAETDHTVMAFGSDTMRLYDTGRSGDHEAGKVLATAQRDGPDQPWMVTSEGAETTRAATRPEAIDQMIHNHALNTCPGEGYSTTVPHGLRETP